MEHLGKWTMLAIVCCWPVAALAQLQLLPDKEPQRVFAGDARKITLAWHNATDKIVDAEIRARILQTSSATTAQSGETSWKKLQLLPQQTVLESAQLDFPAVNAETKFLVQWMASSNQIFGATEVLVYPTNLFHELKPMLNEETFGVLDPNNELKPLLKQNDLKFLDLGEMTLEDFQGKLAIIGPFDSKNQMREGLEKTIQQIARKGVAVIWIVPPPSPKDELKPSFYLVPEGKGVILVVQPELVADLAERPQSQLNLIWFCKWTLNPKPLTLPFLPSRE